jgi:hypothetical protein
MALLLVSLALILPMTSVHSAELWYTARFWLWFTFSAMISVIILLFVSVFTITSLLNAQSAYLTVEIKAGFFGLMSASCVCVAATLGVLLSFDNR